MGLLTLVEDRPTPAAVYNWRVYACAMVASFASCMIGYDSAFIGTTLALPSFVKEFGFKHMEAHHLATIKANIVSVYQAGAFFGSLLAYASAFFLGRRQSLWVFSVVFMIGAGIMLAAKNGDLAPILAGRVLAGIGVGGCSMIVSFMSLFSQGSLSHDSTPLEGTNTDNLKGSYLYFGNLATCYPWTSGWSLRDGLANWRSRRLLDQRKCHYGDVEAFQSR
jgi:MFS family permease